MEFSKWESGVFKTKMATEVRMCFLWGLLGGGLHWQHGVSLFLFEHRVAGFLIEFQDMLVNRSFLSNVGLLVNDLDQWDTVSNFNGMQMTLRQKIKW